MSKLTDESKIENIRESAISLTGRKGAGNASVAKIARDAGVSAGYLYRHYIGKEELINDILQKTLDIISDKIEELLSIHMDTEEIIRGFIGYLFETSEKNPDKIKFILTLQNDFSYNFPEKLSVRIKKLCENIIKKGVKTGDITKNITAEEMYLTLICLPLQYIGIQIRKIFGENYGRNEIINKITALCVSAIK